MADDTLTQEELRRRNREYQREYYQQRKAEKMERWRARVAADPEAWRKKNREGMARFRARQRELNPPPPEPTTEERFLKKIEKDPASGCWFWGGTLNHKGYSVMKVDGKLIFMHRWAYEHYVGPIPGGLTIDHKCRVRHCVNPEHMEPVTNAENKRRGTEWFWKNAATTRPTHCPNGHPYVDGNVIYSGKDKQYRSCRICVNINQMKRYYAKRYNASS